MSEPLLNLRIAPMVFEDVAEVHRLETLCFTAPWDIESYYGELANPSAVYMVVHADDRILGFGGMWVVQGEAHIVTLAVDPVYRRHGIGRQLLQALIAIAERLDVAVITLEVRVSNTPAKELYQSFGFRTIAKRRHYYPDNGEDAAVMELVLT